jgi:two-component system sensor histidine kinase KdpD
MTQPLSKPAGLGRRLLYVERLMYALTLLPFITDYAEHGRGPLSPREWITEAAAVILILAFMRLLRRARKDIEAIDGLRKNLTQVLIHDLKNPLASIIAGVSAAIQDGEAGRSEGSIRLLKVVLRSAKSQSALIDTLLEMDRLENDELQPRCDWVDMARLIDGCVEAASAAAAGRSVRVENLSRDSMTKMFVDENLLRRVLSNLLSNALKYTPDDGTVSVRAVPEEGRVLMEVTDTGPGVPAEHLSRLFGKFFRVEGQDQSRRRGTGLGMYFCKLAVEAHGGSIRAENAPSGGLLVRFDLPQPAGAAPA